MNGITPKNLQYAAQSKTRFNTNYPHYYYNILYGILVCYTVSKSIMDKMLKHFKNIYQNIINIKCDYKANHVFEGERPHPLLIQSTKQDYSLTKHGHKRCAK